MGLFDKKNCDICGGKIGMLGNRKLDDGNLCKDCASKLSPFFSERRHSTVNDIRAQLDYRAQNQNTVNGFNPTRMFGTGMKVYIDDNQGLILFSRARDWRGDNPDVLRFDQIIGCSVDIEQHRHEQSGGQPGGQPGMGGPGMNRPGQPPMGGPGMNRPGQPPMGGPGMNRPGQPPMGGPGMNRPGQPGMGGPGMNRPGQPGMGGPGMVYYTYDFNIIVNVNSPWFSEIKFQLNPSSVRDSNQADYNNWTNEAEQIRYALQSLTQANVENIAAQNAPKTAATCPHCGATTIPDANGCCEFCGGAIGF